MDNLYNVSSCPHVRSKLTTQVVMTDVLIALLPTAVLGVLFHGFQAFLVIALSMLSAVITEFLFNKVTHRKQTIGDRSAMVTGLLLALTMPAKVPFYLPILGAVFAILVVKCLFGGLGHNIMNPALTGRAFLLISFGSMMTVYSVDGVSAATPLALLAEGQVPSLLPILMGSASGVIGSSALGLILGGIYLLARGGITWEIPVSMIGTTWLFLVIFGGHGVNPNYILPQLFGGGLLMAAFFMATDPVSCPSTRDGQLVFGFFAGLLVGLFRVKGASPDSTTYAVLIADLVGPVIDDLIIPTPFGYRIPKERKKAIPKPVIILLVITLVAGLALSGVYVLTKDTIAENQASANKAALMEVLPEATDFTTDEAFQEKLAAQGDTYGADFGGAKIESAAVGVDASGNPVGYAVTVFNSDSCDGGLTLVVGIREDGTVNSISFTELHDTAGMGMKCGDAEFKDQFNNVKVSQFTLNKAGGSTAENEIDSVSGASITSGAVVNAVNAALDFVSDRIG